MSNDITIYEVGPRDGLQNESGIITVEQKIKLVEMLANAGLKKIEAGSFVSPKWVPQMASSDEVLKSITRLSGVSYSALTPNLRGFEAALDSKADEVAVFAAASETFSQKNINCSIDESIERFIPVAEQAKENGIALRGYVSCIAGCPYEGDIDAEEVVRVSKKLLELGCYEVSLGDTIGVGTAKQVSAVIKAVASEISVKQIAIHCHDTYGQAVANVYAALEAGVTTIDSSVAGLGGCPYAAGASGNVASEDIVYLSNGLGLNSDVDLNKLIAAGDYISKVLGRRNQSKVAQAISAKE